jgi:hypothetical protein
VATTKDPPAPAAPVADTAAPARNFTLSIDERLRAYAQGPLAWMRRRRAIEDLEATLARRIAAGAAADGGALAADFVADLARLNELIDRHNRYYPIEANLPIDPRTGRLLERGRPWRPLAPVTLADLLLRDPERVPRPPR